MHTLDLPDDFVLLLELLAGRGLPLREGLRELSNAVLLQSANGKNVRASAIRKIAIREKFRLTVMG